jgi:hypothetical protein
VFLPVRRTARRGLAWGLSSGYVAGALFGLFVNVLDTGFGKIAALGAAAAAKGNKDPHFPIPTEPRGAASFTVGFFLALLVAWVIRRGVRTSDTATPAPQPTEGVGMALVDHLVLTLFLAVLAAICGALSLAPLGPGSPVQFVFSAAVVAAMVAGAYGALFGWMEGRRGGQFRP